MKSNRLRKHREDPVAKLARTIVPAEQVRSDLAIRDVANHAEGDQRDMTRGLAWDSKGRVKSGDSKTVRRLTRVELLVKAGNITLDQAAACSWYATAHELGFQTVGCTANYGGAGGGGFGSTDLLARYKAQSEAREDYFFARSAIPQHLLQTFEGIVLGKGRPPHMLPKADKLRFSLAAFLLHQQIGHMLAIAA